MDALEPVFVDSFSSAGTGTAWDAALPCAWVPTSDGVCGASVTVQCSVCGHVVTASAGDEPILFGDPRLCEHMGGPPC